MTSEETLLEQIKVLPPDLKREVEHFVEFLQTKVKTDKPRRSLKGALADLNINITDEDIRQARNEMWRGYTEDTEDEK
ncbi:MAG TPA: DUF2281 domain-containing protein [Pyrinomonadaceae bacterium]|jgi:hypothetical protein